MYTYHIELCYDGTDFAGWQVQPGALTIQETLENALRRLLQTPTPPRVIGASRTDAGVHAQGQSAHVCLPETFPPESLCKSWNGVLPPTIRILSARLVPSTFHAQYSATGKIYHYHLWLSPTPSPFHRRYHYHFSYPTDVSLLEEAAALFVGEHDFTSFANIGSHPRHPIRTLKRLEIHPQEGGIRLEFEAEGFLYKMVRNITGTLLEIARGKRPLADVPHLFAARDRRAAGMTAPPQGLFLMRVFYPF